MQSEPCPSCGHRFDGIAATCPKCQAPLPPAEPALRSPTSSLNSPAPPPEIGPRGGGTRKVPRVLITVVTVCVAAAILGYVGFALFSCTELNLNGEPPGYYCAETWRSADLYFLLIGIPWTLLSGVLAWRLSGRKRAPRSPASPKD